MKLRFRPNSVRLRVNRREVAGLAAGQSLREQVHFPDNSEFAYVLQSVPSRAPEVEFKEGVMRVGVPVADLQSWASTQEIGLYFELPANGDLLKIAVEKDLECVDGSPEERDPDAFPRKIC
jgi:hypothetical protein